jgi:hypothetical protein
VVVFGDDRDPAAVYALAAAPRIARDEQGRPELSLVLYGARGADGRFEARGGLVSLTTTTGIEPAEERAVLDARARRAAPGSAPTRRSADFTEGRVSVRLTPDVSLEGAPSLVGDNRCSFSVRLDRDPAVALRSAWDRGLPDASIRYELTPRPSPGATSRVEVRRSETATRDRSGGTRTTEERTARTSVTRPHAAVIVLEGPLRLERRSLADRVTELPI